MPPSVHRGYTYTLLSVIPAYIRSISLYLLASYPTYETRSKSEIETDKGVLHVPASSATLPSMAFRRLGSFARAVRKRRKETRWSLEAAQEMRLPLLVPSFSTRRTIGPKPYFLQHNISHWATLKFGAGSFCAVERAGRSHSMCFRIGKEPPIVDSPRDSQYKLTDRLYLLLRRSTKAGQREERHAHAPFQKQAATTEGWSNEASS